MAAKNAVVRSLPSVETLGSCSVICSDKTGTLTTNQMSVNKVVYLNETGSDLVELDVEGTTFAPKGAIKSDGKAVEGITESSETVRQIAEVAAVCNDARLAYDSRTGAFSNVGEATEGALRVLVEKLGPCAPSSTHPDDCVHYANSTYEKRLPRISTYEFSRDRKSMSVLVKDGKQQRLLVKGAPESIIDRCSHVVLGAHGKKVAINKKLSETLLREVVEYGNRGLRVIALASVDDASKNPLTKTAKTTEQYLQLEQNMTLIGLVGMLDPQERRSLALFANARKPASGLLLLLETTETLRRAFADRLVFSLSTKTSRARAILDVNLITSAPASNLKPPRLLLCFLVSSLATSPSLSICSSPWERLLP
uniref:Cation-transporting P-type ATPase C-terminal domain-containing protein n=1 Tax=Bionectria ochroleuca TaxID=29856 RepID=A0A8H7TQM3_BIOOC